MKYKCECEKCGNMLEREGLYCFSCEECFSNQPERLSEKTLEDGFYPPPWNIYEHPEKTEGWIEFQRAVRKDPKYYLQGSDSLNS